MNGPPESAGDRGLIEQDGDHRTMHERLAQRRQPQLFDIERPGRETQAGFSDEQTVEQKSGRQQTTVDRKAELLAPALRHPDGSLSEG